MNLQDAQNQTCRVLSLFNRLCKGDIIVKRQEANYFQVGEKTIQRDINSIREFLETSELFKKEMGQLIDRITDLAQPHERSFVKQLMLNEKHLYTELQHNQNLFSLLWNLGRAYILRILTVLIISENTMKRRVVSEF